MRYMDDIYNNTNNEDEVKELVELFEKNSCLKFTYKVEEDDKIVFLDTVVERREGYYSTEVYVKDTNLGFCLNGRGESAQKYKMSVIN